MVAVEYGTLEQLNADLSRRELEWRVVAMAYAGQYNGIVVIYERI